MLSPLLTVFLPAYVFYNYLYRLAYRRFWTKGYDFNWQAFTYLTSTFNAIYCTTHASKDILKALNTDFSDYSTDPFNFYYAQVNSDHWLYVFAAYLFTDGMYNLLTMNTLNTKELINLLHHFVGGFGIFFIAWYDTAYFIGLYFGFTEISTILLNITWFLYQKNNSWMYVSFGLTTLLFFAARIVTIPILLIFLGYNQDYISLLPSFQQWYIYLGVRVLFLTNLVWLSKLIEKSLSLL